MVVGCEINRYLSGLEIKREERVTVTNQVRRVA
jgi:hypothetical protein